MPVTPRKSGRKPNLTALGVDQKKSYIQPPYGTNKDFKREWNQIVKDFPPDWFRVSDIGLITETVRLKIQIDILNSRVLNEDAFVAVDEYGKVKIHPLIQVLQDLRSKYLAYSRACRAAPSARMQMTQVPKPPKSLDDEPKKRGRKDAVDLSDLV